MREEENEKIKVREEKRRKKRKKIRETKRGKK